MAAAKKLATPANTERGPGVDRRFQSCEWQSCHETVGGFCIAAPLGAGVYGERWLPTCTSSSMMISQDDRLA
jgi:hypothetical protein